MLLVIEDRYLDLNCGSMKDQIHPGWPPSIHAIKKMGFQPSNEGANEILKKKTWDLRESRGSLSVPFKSPFADAGMLLTLLQRCCVDLNQRLCVAGHINMQKTEQSDRPDCITTTEMMHSLWLAVNSEVIILMAHQNIQVQIFFFFKFIIRFLSYSLF